MKLRHANNGAIIYWRPGCDEPHQIVSSIWAFNGNDAAPTFTPSVLVTSGHYTQGHQGPQCWCTYNAKAVEPAPFKCSVCHCYVTDGRIQFLSDSTHALAGQTVEMPEWPELYEVNS